VIWGKMGKKKLITGITCHNTAAIKCHKKIKAILVKQDG